MGWARVAILALAVVTVGFGVGLVAGLAWQEPGLVADYLTGQTEAIEWGTESASEGEALARAEGSEAPPSEMATPPVAAPPPRSASKPDYAAAPPAPPVATAPAPASRSTSSPASGFAVQVGAFADEHSAQQLAERLKADGYGAYVASGTGAGARWRVRVGPLPSRDQAEKVAERLKSVEKLPTWVSSEDS